MTITAIKAQIKNTNRASVFVDEKYSFSLTLDQIIEQKVRKGVEIDQLKLDEFKKLSDEGKLKARALEWLLMRPHSTRELRDYGYRKQIEKELIEVWIEDFRSKKYLDDEAFAIWFAENRVRKNKSSRAIVAELGTKGIPRSVAEQAISGLQNDDNSLANLIQKLRSRPRYKDNQKLMTYLAGKGFSYTDIKKALSEQD